MPGFFSSTPGRFSLASMCKNLGPVGLDVPGAITPSDDPAPAWALVWGLPWRVPHPEKSWINLSPFESDEYGVPRAYVHLVTTPAGLQTWTAMDQAAVALAQAMAGDPVNTQYLWGGTWRAEPFPLHQPFLEWHRGLGTTYHESGTLWMATTPATSISNPFGRFHHVWKRLRV